MTAMFPVDTDPPDLPAPVAVSLPPVSGAGRWWLHADGTRNALFRLTQRAVMSGRFYGAAGAFWYAWLRYVWLMMIETGEYDD